MPEIKIKDLRPTYGRERTPFNLNDYVWVKLKPKGLEMLDAHFNELYKRHNLSEKQKKEWQLPVTQNADGWSKWQLWHLMETFGPAMGIGLCDFMDTQIMFEAPTYDEENPWCMSCAYKIGREGCSCKEGEN